MGTAGGPARWLAETQVYQSALASGRLSSYHKRRWADRQRLAQLLAPEALPNLTEEQALALYRASGGNRMKDFNSNAIEDIRDSLDFLLYDTIKLEGRFDECAAEGGGYKLAGAGKEFVSYLLCLKDPGLFAVWNSHAEGALRKLGTYPAAMRQGLLGLRYLDLLDALQVVRRQTGLADFSEVDQFCYAVNRLARTRRDGTAY